MKTKSEKQQQTMETVQQQRGTVDRSTPWKNSKTVTRNETKYSQGRIKRNRLYLYVTLITVLTI